MLNELLIWGALLVGLIVLAVDKRRGSGAMTLAYFLMLSLGHVPGLLAYFDPNANSDATKVGLDVTLIGMTAFISGAVVAARIWPRRAMVQQTSTADRFSQIGWRVLMIGVVSYFLVLPISSLLPSLTAVTSVLGTLLILGFWLRLYSTGREGDNRQRLTTLAMVPLLPITTLATGGFIGFGTSWALSIVAFLFVITQRRIWFYLGALPVAFLGLSLFVTYFEHRDDIRSVAWDPDSSTSQRLERVSSMVTDFQLLDLSNERHLFALDERLNQNFLVGTGVMRHREGEVGLWYGATVPIWALIPRAIWPDKPPVGGSEELVSEFTGFSFAEGTSIGAGQVLEFYMNFAIPGVIIGFAVLGFILMRLDQGMMRAFAMRDVNSLMSRAMPGLALLMPLGSLLETLVAVVTAIIVSQLLVYSKLLGWSPAPSPTSKVSGWTERVIERR